MSTTPSEMTPREKGQYALWHDARVREWSQRLKDAVTLEQQDNCREHIRKHREWATKLRNEAAHRL